MRTSDEITVSKSIVHLVDPRDENMTLSEGALPPNKQIREYLANHIRKSLQDAAARTACFRRVGDEVSELLGTCSGLISGKIGFVDGTQTIAKQLYKASDRRISAGALVVCFYTAASHPDIKRFLAIMKLDPSDGFQPTEVSGDNGKVFVRLNPVENVVPSNRERLLKCAFVRPRDVSEGEDGFDDYDMVVLDRQKPESEEPAHFFTSDFLGAELFGDSAKLTRAFYLDALGGLEEIKADIGPAKAEVVRRAIDTAVSGTSVDVEEWVENLRIAKAAKKKMLTKLEKRIPDASFETDERVANQLTKKRVFKGDYGFKLQFEADQYDQLVVRRTVHDDHEELHLRVPNLREVEK